jgi:Fe2+ transport system protein B
MEEKNFKGRSVNFYMSYEDYEKLQELSKQESLNISEYIRRKTLRVENVEQFRMQIEKFETELKQNSTELKRNSMVIEDALQVISTQWDIMQQLRRVRIVNDYFLIGFIIFLMTGIFFGIFYFGHSIPGWLNQLSAAIVEAFKQVGK